MQNLLTINILTIFEVQYPIKLKFASDDYPYLLQHSH